MIAFDWESVKGDLARQRGSYRKRRMNAALAGLGGGNFAWIFVAFYIAALTLTWMRCIGPPLLAVPPVLPAEAVA